MAGEFEPNTKLGLGFGMALTASLREDASPAKRGRGLGRQRRPGTNGSGLGWSPKATHFSPAARERGRAKRVREGLHAGQPQNEGRGERASPKPPMTPAFEIQKTSPFIDPQAFQDRR